jgi:phosphatidylserine decarboxylase
MEAYSLASPVLVPAGAAALGFLYWRYVWFFRNPPRTPPKGDGILSPADGTVVYVKEVEPHEDVITIKRGVKAALKDIVREDIASPKLLIGIFMSPFNVHYNRAPLSGEIELIRHYPAEKRNLHMGSMHLRTLLKRAPYYRNSLHIVQNERKVTRFNGHIGGACLSCYVVQIAAKSVSGIDSYVKEGEKVRRGEIFGMIRIGSQVDIVVPWEPAIYGGMRVLAKPGDKVRAGETVLIGLE